KVPYLKHFAVAHAKFLSKRDHIVTARKMKAASSRRTPKHFVRNALKAARVSRSRRNAWRVCADPTRMGVPASALFRIGSSGSSGRSSHRGLLDLFRFSFRVHTTAGVVGLRSCRVWREVSEHLGVGALRAGGAVEFCQ